MSEKLKPHGKVLPLSLATALLCGSSLYAQDAQHYLDAILSQKYELENATATERDGPLGFCFEAMVNASSDYPFWEESAALCSAFLINANVQIFGSTIYVGCIEGMTPLDILDPTSKREYSEPNLENVLNDVAVATTAAAMSLGRPQACIDPMRKITITR